MYYVSPTQININMPDDTATGPVQVVVKTAGGTSAPVTINRTRISPTLQSVPQFNIGGKQYVVALTTNFASFIGRPGILAGVSFVAPKPGDTITIYALGLGPTNPATSAGVTASATGNVTLPLQLKIGGVPASVPFSGLLKDTIGLVSTERRDSERGRRGSEDRTDSGWCRQPAEPVYRRRTVATVF
ncbi:MAG: hypothetical protein WDO18_03005 [Acidobacteriota bacterium]